MVLRPRRRSVIGPVTILVWVPFLLVACVSVNRFKPPRTLEGLQLVPHAQVDVLYTAPELTLAAYHAVILDPVDVGFKRDWKSSHSQLTEADIQRMRAEVADLFRKVFAQELGENGGYQLTEIPAANVLRVRASIVDLDISPASGSSASERGYQISPRDVTLVAELRDSVSGAILVRAADREKGRVSGDLQVESGVSGSAEAAQLFGVWAGLLRRALDAARETPSPAG